MNHPEAHPESFPKSPSQAAYAAGLVVAAHNVNVREVVAAAEADAADRSTTEQEALRAENERLRYEALLRDQVIDAYEVRTEAAEAKVRAVEALVDRWEHGADTWGTCSHEWVSLRALRAALAEAAPALPTSQTTEGGCSDAPAEPHNPADHFDDLYEYEPPEVTPPAEQPGVYGEDRQCTCCWDGHDGDCGCVDCKPPAEQQRAEGGA